MTTSGSLGILIPPSIAMVIYAVSTNSSIGKLFMAGVIPGIMLATMLGVTTWYRAWKNNYPRLPKATMLERVHAFRNASWGLLLIVIVIGGIYIGTVHADRSRRDERGLCVLHRRLRLQGHQA